MALYRARYGGQHPDGSARWINEGETFHWDGKPGAWMELAESKAEAPPSPAPSNRAEEIAVALDEAPLVKDEEKSEAAPAASKRRARKGD
jgi:hypothetical protein